MKFLLRYLLLLLLMFGAIHNVEAQKRKKGKSKKERKKKKGKSKKKKRSKKAKRKKSSSKGGKLSKKEKKKWKQKLKSLTPEKYKKLMTEYYALKDRVASAEEEVATCQNSISEKEELIGRYQKEVTKLRKTGNKADTKSATASSSAPQDVSGVTYRIQIGAYEKINLSQYAQQENFGVEQANNLQKFTIGLFRNYREADSLKKYLQQMGVKDAWVVAYRDGSRVDVKEVLNQSGGAK